MQIPPIPTLNAAPEPRASVSTPESTDFRAVWDAARPSADADRKRGNGASKAEVAPIGSAEPRESRSGDRRREAGERCGARSGCEGRGATDSTRQDAESTETTHACDPADADVEVGSEVDAGGAEAPIGSVEIEEELDPTSEIDGVVLGASDPHLPLTEVATHAPAWTGDALSAADPSGAGLAIDGASRRTEDPRATGTTGSTGADLAIAHADETADVRIGATSTSNATAASAATVVGVESPATGAPTIESTGTPVDGVASGTSTGPVIADAVRPASTPIPEGLRPITPAPIDSAATGTASASVAAAASSSSRPRPNAAAGAAEPSETPAAVARAAQVNRSIEAGRHGTTAATTEGITASAVAPANGGDAAHAANRHTAQSLPTAGAEAAPSTTGEVDSRTTPGVARGLQTLARQKGGSLVMRLDPPSLGPLRLDMRMEGGRVTVLMTAASESARALLRDNLGSLRTALEDRGLAVDRLAVESAGRTHESSSNARSEHRGDGRGDGQDARGGQDASGRQDAGDGRSRGRRDDASGRQQGRGDGPGRQEAADFSEALAGAGASDH